MTLDLEREASGRADTIDDSTGHVSVPLCTHKYALTHRNPDSKKVKRIKSRSRARVLGFFLSFLSLWRVDIIF